MVRSCRSGKDVHAGLSHCVGARISVGPVHPNGARRRSAGLWCGREARIRRQWGSENTGIAARGGLLADLDTVRHAVGVPVIVREHTVQDDPQQDLVDAWIAITPAFSARIDGKRGGTQLTATGRQALATGAQEGVSE